MSPYETVWIFNTAHFTVSLDVAPEEMDPEGNFASGDDDLDAQDSYHSLADFRAGGYFRDMVAEAIGEARAHVGRLASVKLRAA